jgi:hypothetical protein
LIKRMEIGADGVIATPARLAKRTRRGSFGDNWLMSTSISTLILA